MLRSLLTRSLRDAALWTVAASAVLLVLAAVAVPAYAAFGDEYLSLLEDMPDWMAVVYGPEAASVGGLVGTAMFSLMGPLVILVYAVALGTSAAVGEEEAQTLPLLMANPVSRRRILGTKTTVVVGGIILVAAVLWVGIEVIASVVAIDMEGQDILAASVHLAALAMLFGALALGVAAWTGSSVVGIGVAAVVAVLSYVLSTWLPIVEGLSELATWSPWHLYAGANALRDGVDGLLLAVALGLAAGFFVVGLMGLQRRDLKG